MSKPASACVCGCASGRVDLQGCEWMEAEVGRPSPSTAVGGRALCSILLAQPHRFTHVYISIHEHPNTKTNLVGDDVEGEGVAAVRGDARLEHRQVQGSDVPCVFLFFFGFLG